MGRIRIATDEAKRNQEQTSETAMLALKGKMVQETVPLSVPAFCAPLMPSSPGTTAEARLLSFSASPRGADCDDILVFDLFFVISGSQTTA